MFITRLRCREAARVFVAFILTVAFAPVIGAQPATMSGPLGISMTRMGSGTSWVPDDSHLPARHVVVGAWNLMLHGAVHLQYINEGGSRGDDQIGSLNWLMLMASRSAAGGSLQLRTMLSAEPATASARGYPLLLQTGETADGEPLHDRQHPHDAWMELATLYEREVGRGVAASLYAAAAGEPALGPVAYMHPPSAMDNPLAPLSHHWQDATHVTFGVVTAGVFTQRWKLEGSVFNGREPDEDRWDFDLDRLDSYSGRVTLNPSSSWSLSAGYGFLRGPERIAPDGTAHRVTASVLHAGQTAAGRRRATSLVWGANSESGHATTTHAIVAESQWTFGGSHTVFGRAELVQKSAADLVLPEPEFDHDAVFDVTTLSLGYVAELGTRIGVSGAIGLRGGVSAVPDALRAIYGTRTPVGGMLFLRMRPVGTSSTHQHD
jgi:hypothetical protein